MNRWEVPEPEKKVIDYANLTSRQRAFYGQAGAADPLENVSRSASASRSWGSDASGLCALCYDPLLRLCWDFLTMPLSVVSVSTN